MKNAVFEGNKFVNDIKNLNNDTRSNVVDASGVPPRYLLDASTHLYKRSGPLVRRSVGPFVRPVLFLNDEYGSF